VANRLQIPEHIVGVGQEYIPNIHIRKSASIGLLSIDPIRILESDFLRWLILAGGKNPQIIKIAVQNVKEEDLQNPLCRGIYRTYLQRIHNSLQCDLLSLIQEEEDQELLSSLMDKKVNIERAEEHFIDTVQKILDRNWMEKREEIKRKIQSGQCGEEEAITLLKEFDDLKKMAPKVILLMTQ
jgi:DNA primase